MNQKECLEPSLKKTQKTSKHTAMTLILTIWIRTQILCCSIHDPACFLFSQGSPGTKGPRGDRGDSGPPVNIFLLVQFTINHFPGPEPNTTESNHFPLS